jgi:hypothetical protein
MKRSVLWGLAAAAGSALAAPGIFGQVAGIPADETIAQDPAQFLADAARPVETPADIPAAHDPLVGAVGGAPVEAKFFGVMQNPRDLAPLTVRVLHGLPAEGADEESVKLMQDNARLSAEIQQLAMVLRDANEETRMKAGEKLNGKVAEQFDVRQRMRERQLAALEEQVQRLRKTHNERGMQRDRIVNDRVQQLVREAQGLGWGDVGDGDAFKYGWSADAADALMHRKMLSGKPAKVVEWIGGADLPPAVAK